MTGRQVHKASADLERVDKLVAIVASERGKASKEAVDTLMSLALDKGQKIVYPVVKRLIEDTREHAEMASRLHFLLRSRATRSRKGLDQAIESFTGGLNPNIPKVADWNLLKTIDRKIPVPETLRAYHGNSYDWEGEFAVALKTEKNRSKELEPMVEKERAGPLKLMEQ